MNRLPRKFGNPVGSVLRNGVPEENVVGEQEYHPGDHAKLPDFAFVRHSITSLASASSLSPFFVACIARYFAARTRFHRFELNFREFC
jgi:hypothetical protein